SEEHPVISSAAPSTAADARLPASAAPPLLPYIQPPLGCAGPLCSGACSGMLLCSSGLLFRCPGPNPDIRPGTPTRTILPAASPGRRRPPPPVGTGAAPGRNGCRSPPFPRPARSEEHTSELQSRENLVC